MFQGGMGAEREQMTFGFCCGTGQPLTEKRLYVSYALIQHKLTRRLPSTKNTALSSVPSPESNLLAKKEWL
jgi:hypothetical protein